MKRNLLFIVLILLHTAVYAQHSCSRNESAVKYRNDYLRVNSSRNNAFEVRKGKLYGWGSNVTGALGIGNNIDQYAPIQVGTDSNWKNVTVSIIAHTLAVKSDGAMWAWGYNGNGQLGLGNLLSTMIPIQVGLDHDWVHVAVGERHTLAIKADGSLWATGYNHYGQLGLGDTISRNIFTQVGTAHDWVSIAAALQTSWALKADGSLWGWGNNGQGQLGQGDTMQRENPEQIGNSQKWVLVSDAEANYFMGLQSDGTLWACGWNANHGLGLGDTIRRLNLVQVNGDHDWVSVSAGGNTMALKANGQLWGWGADQGSLGLGDPNINDVPYPIQINASNDWVAVSAHQKTYAMKTAGNIWATGLNEYGQMGLGYADPWNPIDTYTHTSTPAREWISGAAGGTHTVALYSDGTLWAWGNNGNGQLGTGNTTEQHEPIQVGADTAWVAVMAGTAHTLGMKSDGRIWGWGKNTDGQLGIGNTIEQHSPVQLTGIWASMATGDVHSLALKADGTLWAWGNNNTGQLGLGNYTSHNSPVQVGLDSTWIAIAAGEGHTLGLKANGTLWAWGLNIYGQLGIGNNTIQTAPVQIGTDHNWTAITAGANHSMALKADGTLWAWGRNADGQLGTGNNTNSNVPVQVSGINWIAINAGSAHSIAYKADGSIYSWGNNDYGQLGLGNNTGQNSPQPITQPAIVHIFTGAEADQTGIIKDTRSLVCLAGRNDHGQLGDSSTIAKNTFSCINDCVIPGISITVNPNDTVCNGDTVVFTAVITNGGPTPVYQWYKNNMPVGNNNNLYTVNGGINNGDVIKCVLTGSAGCMITPTDTSNEITMVTVNSVTPTIAIAADLGDTICQEHVSIYTATITNGGLNPVYQWYENNNPVGSNMNTYEPMQINGNIIKCKLTSSAVCATPQSVTSTPHTMLITPVTTPQVTITANPGTNITPNQSVTFTAAVTNATNPQYQWKKNGNSIAGATQATYTSNTLQNGDIIKCRVRGLSVCDTAYSNTITIAVFPVGVEQISVNSEQITVWPNPVKQSGLTLSLSKGEGTYTVSLCDVVGKELIRSEWDGVGEKHIDMKGLASGVYLLRVLGGDGRAVVRKVVKE